MSLTLELNLDNFKKLTLEPSLETFSINFRNDSITVNPFLVSQVSETISVLLWSDPLASSINLDISNNSCLILKEYIKTRKCNFTENSVEDLLKTGLLLRMKDLINSIMNTFMINHKILIDTFLIGINNGGEINSISDHIASEIQNFYSEGLLDDIPCEALTILLNSPNCILPFDLIDNLISSRFKNINEIPSSTLAKYYPFCSINVNEVKSIFSQDTFNFNLLRDQLRFCSNTGNYQTYHDIELNLSPLLKSKISVNDVIKEVNPFAHDFYLNNGKISFIFSPNLVVVDSVQIDSKEPNNDSIIKIFGSRDKKEYTIKDEYIQIENSCKYEISSKRYFEAITISCDSKQRFTVDQIILKGSALIVCNH